MKAILALFALLLFAAPAPAHAREGYADNGRPLVCNPQEYEDDADGLKACQNWISGVLQPHSKTTCCGEGDAYIADEWEQGEDGGWVAIVTRDYPETISGDDGEGGTVTTLAIPKGTRFPIPANRMDDEHQGNPTGHGIVFVTRLSNGDLVVLCFFTKSLA